MSIANVTPVPQVTVGRVRQRLQWRRRTLHGQFRGLLEICLLTAVLALLGIFYALRTTQTNFEDIISNSAPSIIAAQTMGQALEDADAKAADYQLASRITGAADMPIYGTSGKETAAQLRTEAWQTFLNRRTEFEAQLFKARANITYGGETEAVASIEAHFLDYLGSIYVMKHEVDIGHREAALSAYTAAHSILVGTGGGVQLDAQGLGPEEESKLRNWDGDTFDIARSYNGIEANINKLYEINRRQLVRASTSAQTTLGFFLWLTIILCVALVVSIVLLTVRYSFVTHRIFNIGYTIGVLGSCVLAFVVVTTFAQAQGDYKTVTYDSFISINAVARIRQIANDGNADESRFLLIPDKSGLDVNSPDLTADVKRIFNDATLTQSFTTKQRLIDQQLLVAWNNITYSGERDALCRTTDVPSGATNVNAKQSCARPSYALTTYRGLDPVIRTDFRTGKLTDAILVDTGTSNAAFGNFDAAIVALGTINEGAFDKSACAAIGRTEFGGQCSTSGYLGFGQMLLWILLPILALCMLGGYRWTRNEF